jgi:hypothetical protein
MEDIKSMTKPEIKRWPNGLTPTEKSTDSEFVKARREIFREWRKRGDTDETRSGILELREDWLARTIYRTLRQMVRDGSWTVLQKRVDYERSLIRGRHSIKNRPFKVGLIAFLGETISHLPNRRHELSDAMEYAYIHGVPSKYFNGFVKQAGQKRIANKLKRGHVEPGFDPARMSVCPGIVRDKSHHLP